MHKDPTKRYAYLKQYREAHHEQVRENARKYERANKAKIANQKLIAKYGMTLEQFEEMVIRQNRQCLFCKEIKRLSVDHDHKTGKVRGLLCTECNLALGLFKDSQETLQRAVDYLRA